MHSNDRLYVRRLNTIHGYVYGYVVCPRSRVGCRRWSEGTGVLNVAATAAPPWWLVFFKSYNLFKILQLLQ